MRKRGRYIPDEEKDFLMKYTSLTAVSALALLLAACGGADEPATLSGLCQAMAIAMVKEMGSSGRRR